ncbi:MAG: DUF378 domain-containing protein [bacterium]
MKAIHMVSFILLVVGGLNWLLVGLGAGDLVAMLLGAGSMLARAVYILVGLSAIVLIATHKKDCKMCSSGTPSM